MTFAPRAGAGPVGRSFIGVIATALLLVLLALPAAADGGPLRLARPFVSPSSGTTATTFSFAVTYRNRDGSAPRRVVVVIGGTRYTMVPDGARWKKGVTFSFRTKLPAGEHAVLFAAADTAGNTDTVQGGTVRVGRARPAPRPAPDGRPASEPTPGPDRTAAPKPRTTPAATPVGAAVEPTDAPDSGPDAAGPAGPGVAGPGVAGPGDPRPTPPTTAAGDPPTATGDPSTPGGSGPGDQMAGIPGTWGDLTRYLEALGLDPARSPLLRLVPVMIWTSGGVALVMAFGFFGKRRRDGEPPEPDEVLSAKAARGSGEAATAALVPGDGEPAAPIDAEMAMPRWRRPSLLQARKEDPLRTTAVAARLSFDHAAVAPLDGYERRLIRYLAVHLLDTPDEFRGSPIGSLAQGDEVQLIERSGTYWRVLCPDGQEGWLHRMTLGDTLGVPASPSARETWATTSIEADDVDEDVLVAFMTARGRA